MALSFVLVIKQIKTNMIISFIPRHKIENVITASKRKFLEPFDGRI